MSVETEWMEIYKKIMIWWSRYIKYIPRYFHREDVFCRRHLEFRTWDWNGWLPDFCKTPDRKLAHAQLMIVILQMTRWFCDQGNNYYDAVNKTCFKRSTLWKRPLWHSHRPTDWFRTLAQSQNILFDDGVDNCNTNETLLNIFFILIWLSLLST